MSKPMRDEIKVGGYILASWTGVLGIGFLPNVQDKSHKARFWSKTSRSSSLCLTDDIQAERHIHRFTYTKDDPAVYKTPGLV